MLILTRTATATARSHPLLPLFLLFLLFHFQTWLFCLPFFFCFHLFLFLFAFFLINLINLVCCLLINFISPHFFGKKDSYSTYMKAGVGPNGKLTATRSILSVFVRANDEQNVYTCVALHPFMSAYQHILSLFQSTSSFNSTLIKKQLNSIHLPLLVSVRVSVLSKFFFFFFFFKTKTTITKLTVLFTSVGMFNVKIQTLFLLLLFLLNYKITSRQVVC